MVKYETGKMFIAGFELAGKNQHGSRYKRKEAELVNVLKMSVSFDEAESISGLVAIGESLNIPIRIDWGHKPPLAYVEIIAADSIPKNILF